MTKVPTRMWLNVSPIFYILMMAVVLLPSCMQEGKQERSEYQKISGKTMGTQYHITYRDSLNRSLQGEVDSVLVAVNDELSTYIDSSVISIFNQSTTGIVLEKVGESPRFPHFQYNWSLSREIHAVTDGYFDPTVMPLVNYWGFGYKPQKAVERIDSAKVDSLLQYIGLDKISKIVQDNTGRHYLSKSMPAVELDFGGIAKGYGVDVLAELLHEKGIEDYLVEIGGEVRCSGNGPTGKQWKIGISTPDPEASSQSVHTIVHLDEGSVATSGNYRNYHKIDGQLYGHTISPFTGFPELNRVLSASVFAGDCARADAYATAFMAMGEKKSISMANKLKGIEILLIVSEEDGSVSQVTTPGFDRILSNNQ